MYPHCQLDHHIIPLSYTHTPKTLTVLHVVLLAGDLKLTMPTAFTTAMLAWGLLAFPEGYAKAGQTASALESVRWGTDYLLKTIRTGNIKQTVDTGYTIVYQVGN